MNEKDLQNEKLDRIGRELLEAARVSDAELEKIVAAPHLFASVKARIEAGKSERKAKRFFAFPVWNWQRTALAFGVLAFFFVGAFGLIVFTKQDLPSPLAEIAAPEINLPVAPVEIPPLPQEVSFETVKAVVKNRTTIVKTVETKKPARSKNHLKRQPRSEPQGEFYALNYAGNPVETGESLQIVRTELSPASLFALGVDMPIENVSQKIKTDLLVGSDGVARAIRFVK